MTPKPLRIVALIEPSKEPFKGTRKITPFCSSKTRGERDEVALCPSRGADLFPF